MTDQRDNLNPTPEARLAMAVWSDEYAYEQSGGCMDFWHSIGDSRRNICRRLLRDVARAAVAHGLTLEDMAKEAESR